jgi:hypothetical protein
MIVSVDLSRHQALITLIPILISSFAKILSSPLSVTSTWTFYSRPARANATLPALPESASRITCRA